MKKRKGLFDGIIMILAIAGIIMSVITVYSVANKYDSFAASLEQDMENHAHTFSEKALKDNTVLRDCTICGYREILTIK